MNIIAKLTQRYLPVFLVVSLTLSLNACSDSDDPTPTPDETPDKTEGGIPFYKVQHVEDIYIKVDSKDPNQEIPELLYSLEYQKTQPGSSAKTTNWDLSFGGMYASMLGGNNNSDPTNTGYEGIGKGGIMIVEQAFEDVTDIPDEMKFKTGTSQIGPDISGSYGSQVGWYLYDADGTKMSDGAENKQHVAYALGNPLKLANGTTVPARTVILRTANGNFAKIKMISCYKGITDPAKMFFETPKMYYSFDYVLVPAGSTKFTVK